MAFLVFKIIAVVLGIFNALSTFGMMNDYKNISALYGGGVMVVYYLLLVVGFVIVAANAYIVYLILSKKDRKGLNMIKNIVIGICIVDVASALIFTIVVSAVTGINVFTVDLVSGLIGSILGAIIWNMYLGRSERVKVYFDDKYVEQEPIDIII